MGGDGNDVSLFAGNAATTTDLVTSGSPSVAGQPVTLTATVSSGAGTPDGTVEFFAGAASLGLHRSPVDPRRSW